MYRVFALNFYLGCNLGQVSVAVYINTLLVWAKCFLAIYGVYPGLYELLDTPRHDFLAAQLHLRDSTLPRPLLHRSRGPPTIRSEYVALQPHLALPPPKSSVRLSHEPSVLLHVSLSCDQSICLPSHHSIHDSSVHHPPSVLRNVSQTIRHHPTICTPSYHVRLTVLHRLTLHPPTICTTHQPVRPIVCTTPPPVHQTICHRHTVCTTHQSVRQPVRPQPTV